MSNVKNKILNFIKTTSDFVFYLPSNKTIFLSQPCYRDEYPSILVPASGATAPDSIGVTIGNVARQVYSFDGVNTEERLSVSFEIPHDYKTGGQIEVHVHYRPSDNTSGNVKWFFDWEYSSANGNPIAQTTISVVDTISLNSQYKHKLKAIGFLPALGYSLGDKIGFNIRRTPSDSQDNYGADVFLEQISLHVPIDTLGSRQLYIK